MCERFKKISATLLLIALYLVFLNIDLVFAQYQTYGDYDTGPTFRDHLFKLVRGSFGTLIMVFCGMGGFITLFMRREGKAGEQVPIVGVAMLLIAMAIFVFRVMISSGFLGKDYLDFN